MPVIQSFTNPPPSPHHQSAEVYISIGGDINIAGASPTNATFRANLGGDVSISGEFVFEIPPPFTDEIQNSIAAVYTARLTDSLDNRIKITDVSFSAGKGEIGERVSITVAEKDLNTVALDKSYTLEIGTWNSVQSALDGDAPDWEIVCEAARLASRSYSESRRGKTPSDDLSFQIIESSKNRLNFYPSKNYILYDSLKTSVDLDSAEKTYTSSGDYIKTTASPAPNLTFYKILGFIKDRCGFVAVEKNLPDFPVQRADFPFNQSYAKSLAGIGGMYEPIFSIQPGNILRVQTKFAELAEDFAPEKLLKITGKSLEISQTAHVDGVMVIYSAPAETSAYSDRLVQSSEETGTYGNADFTRTEIARTYRDWFDGSGGEPVRTNLIREVHATYNDSLDLIGRETSDYVYDAQGKRTNSNKTVESLVPDLSAGGATALLTVREETQSIFYQTDSRNPRRQFQSKTVTQIRGLISIDADNQYFENDFRQDLLEAHKAGNLTADMTSEFAPIKTVTETLTPLGNNQFEVRISTTDHVRGNTSNQISEPKTGDASLNGVGGGQKRFVIWADGVTTDTRTGGEIIELSVGELPRSFYTVLAEIILMRRLAGFADGSATVPGWHPSFQKGRFFTLYSRAGEYLGRFIVEAVQSNFSNLGSRNQQVTTTFQISQV